METYLYKEMFELEQQHWWFTAKHQIVLSLLEKYLPQTSGKPRVADIGCGCGRMLQLLGERYQAVGVDGSPVAVEFSKQRGVEVVQGLLPDGLTLPQKSFDAVLMLDVLEHLDDDSAAARAVSRLLKDDGVFLLTVPAYQWLYGPHDAAHHHKRRYNAAGLRAMLQQAGLEIRYLSYYNSLLFPLALAQRAATRLTSGGQVSMKPPAAPINNLFKGIFASERHLLGRVSFPFGLSLIAVAQKQTQKR